MNNKILAWAIILINLLVILISRIIFDFRDTISDCSYIRALNTRRRLLNLREGWHELTLVLLLSVFIVLCSVHFAVTTECPTVNTRRTFFFSFLALWRGLRGRRRGKGWGRCGRGPCRLLELLWPGVELLLFDRGRGVGSDPASRLARPSEECLFLFEAFSYSG